MIFFKKTLFLKLTHQDNQKIFKKKSFFSKQHLELISKHYLNELYTTLLMTLFFQNVFLTNIPKINSQVIFIQITRK